jgi:hypothetical protein
MKNGTKLTGILFVMTLITWVLIAMTVLATTGCDNGTTGSGETGSVTINFGGDSPPSRVAAPLTYPPAGTPALSDLEHAISLDGAVKTTGTGSSITLLEISVGSHKIAIRDTYQGVLYATSEETDVDVVAGGTTTVTINMRPSVTVYFDPANGTASWSEQAGQGEKIGDPSTPAPIPAGSTFAGWYNGATQFVFGTNTVPSIAGNNPTFLLKANWDAPCTITFDTNGGVPATIAPITVALGTTSAGDKPTDPTKAIPEGLYNGAYSPSNGTCSFAGWYSDPPGLNTEFVFGTSTITSNITLTAKWVYPITPVNPTTITCATIVDQAVAYVNTTPGTYTLYLSGNKSVTNANLTASTLSIVGISPCEITRSAATGNVIFVSGAGSVLILENNITIRGLPANNTSAVGSTSTGKFIMNGNSKVTGNTVSGLAGGGGVTIQAGGIFEMNGDSEVSGNDNTAGTSGGQGGGVSVSSASFTMTGNAKVKNNRADGNGKGVYLVNATFTTYSTSSVSGNNGTGTDEVYSSSGNTITVAGNSTLYNAGW